MLLRHEYQNASIQQASPQDSNSLARTHHMRARISRSHAILQHQHNNIRATRTMRARTHAHTQTHANTHTLHNSHRTLQSQTLAITRSDGLLRWRDAHAHTQLLGYSNAAALSFSRTAPRRFSFFSLGAAAELLDRRSPLTLSSRESISSSPQLGISSCTAANRSSD